MGDITHAMKTKITFALITVALFSTLSSEARPAFFNTLMAAYPKISQLRCLTCHASGGGLNYFGSDVAKYAIISGRLDISKIKELDSDKDGVSNHDELTRGTPPGVSNRND